MKLKLINEGWDKTHRLSKIIVKQDYRFNNIGGKETILKAGVYFISGFWCDAVGLDDTLKDARKINNKYLIPAKALMYFYKELKGGLKE